MFGLGIGQMEETLKEGDVYNHSRFSIEPQDKAGGLESAPP